MTRRDKRAIAVLILFGLLALGGVLIWYLGEAPTPFDRQIWLKAGPSTSSDAPRLRMADGLILSKVLLGKPRAEIEEMLGPPTSVEKFQEYDLVYWLGLERGIMAIDSEWLVIRFDSASRVKDAEIVRD